MVLRQGNRRPGRDISTGIVLCAYAMAEFRSRAAASAWPSSGPGLRLCRGRGHVQDGGFVTAIGYGSDVSGVCRGWGLGIPQPKRGCRIGCRCPRVCAWVRGSSGQGDWHPPAFPWVPYRLPVSSCLSGASGTSGPGAWHPLAPSWVPRPGSVLVSVLSWLFFSSVLRCSLFFSFPLWKWLPCRLGCWRISFCSMRTAIDSIDLSLGDDVYSSSLVMLFLARLLCLVFGWLPLPCCWRLTCFCLRLVSRLACPLVCIWLPGCSCSLLCWVLCPELVSPVFGSWSCARNCVIHAVRRGCCMGRAFTQVKCRG